MTGSLPQPGQRHPGVGVRWMDDGTRLAVTTWGSSSHPTVPGTVRVLDGELVLTLDSPAPAASAVSADVAECTTVIEPPAGLDPRSPTRVHVGERVVELPPAGTPVPLAVRLQSRPVRPPRPDSGGGQA